MTRRELQECNQRLSEELKLRWAEKAERYFGIHRGVIVDSGVSDGEVGFQFTSPTVHLVDQVLADFAGFKHCAEAGLPTSWITGLTPSREGGAFVPGCGLLISAERMGTIGVDTFMRIPDLMALDFHSHGASETLTCLNCEKEAASIGLLDGAYGPFCTQCWKELQIEAPGGKMATVQSVRWSLVLPVLTGLTLAGAFLWGFLQQPQRIRHFGMMSGLLPAAWAYGLCWGMPRLSGGVTPMLRFSLFCSVIASVLAGNIWGYRSFVVQEYAKRVDQPVIGPGWMDSVELYFAALPDIWRGEMPFLLGGILGFLIGLRWLKSAETIDVR